MFLITEIRFSCNLSRKNVHWINLTPQKINWKWIFISRHSSQYHLQMTCLEASPLLMISFSIKKVPFGKRFSGARCVFSAVNHITLFVNLFGTLAAVPISRAGLSSRLCFDIYCGHNFNWAVVVSFSLHAAARKRTAKTSISDAWLNHMLTSLWHKIGPK